MKKIICRLGAFLCALIFVFDVSLPSWAMDTTGYEIPNVSVVELSDEMAQTFFEAALKTYPNTYNGNETKYIDGGITAYSNGYVKQTIISAQKADEFKVTAMATDHWFRSFSDTPVCDVSIMCTFTFNDTIATCDKDRFSFKYKIFEGFAENTWINEKKTTFKNGVTGSTTARVDCDYSVNWMTSLDNETISMTCDKNGNITRIEQNEWI